MPLPPPSTVDGSCEGQVAQGACAAAEPGGGGVLVRPLEAADKPRWLQLFRDYIAWYGASVPDAVIELTWRRLMAGGEGNHQGLVATAPDSVGGRAVVVGIAHMLLHRSTWADAGYMYLEDLYVDANARAHGVGAALIAATYAAATAQGADKVYWQTQEFNYRARGLYDKVATKSAFIVYEKKL